MILWVNIFLNAEDEHNLHLNSERALGITSKSHLLWSETQKYCKFKIRLDFVESLSTRLTLTLTPNINRLLYYLSFLFNRFHSLLDYVSVTFRERGREGEREREREREIQFVILNKMRINVLNWMNEWNTIKVEIIYFSIKLINRIGIKTMKQN